MRRSSTPFYVYLIYLGIFCALGVFGSLAFYDLEVPPVEVVTEVPFEKLPQN